MIMYVKLGVDTLGVNPQERGNEAAVILRLLCDRIAREGLDEGSFFMLRDGGGKDVGYAGMQDRETISGAQLKR